MRLAEYLEATNSTQSAFAVRVGMSRSYVNEITSGAKTPSLKAAARIAEATGGAVTVMSWLQDQSPSKAPVEGAT